MTGDHKNSVKRLVSLSPALKSNISCHDPSLLLSTTLSPSGGKNFFAGARVLARPGQRLRHGEKRKVRSSPERCFLDQHYTSLRCLCSTRGGHTQTEYNIYSTYLFLLFSHFSVWLLNSGHYKIVRVTHWSLQLEAEQHRDTLTAGSDMSAGED